jgi:KaiC/GvpD/RAD55 family RecA-like ATPase/DNA-binding NarL/FixJ family response regulator
MNLHLHERKGSALLSSGIPELDERVGGVMPGRYYLLTGTPGSGKTTAAMQFLGEGIRNRQPCLILTQENPEDLFTQAHYLGHDFEAAAASDALIVLQYRMDFSRNYARLGNPRAVSRELLELASGQRPQRIVVDTILPFVQAGSMADGAVTALLHIMEEIQPTGFFTVPGDLSDNFYARLYDPLISGTAGVFHFELFRDDVRELTIRKIRQRPHHTEPLRFVIRAGVGIVSCVDNPVAPIAAEARRRAALIDPTASVNGELLSSLRLSYEFESFDSFHRFGPNDGRFGVVLIALDPLDAQPALQFVHGLRKAGDGVPVALLAPSAGLRAATRTRALRAGADELVTLDAPLAELLAKIEAARERGPRNAAERVRRETLLVQPRDSAQNPLPISEQELARALRLHMASTSPVFFALVAVDPAAGTEQEVWRALSKQLRLDEGDLIALADSGEWVCFIRDISRRHARELVDRIFEADPRLQPPRTVNIQCFPLDRPQIEARLVAAEYVAPVRALG